MQWTEHMKSFKGNRNYKETYKVTVDISGTQKKEKKAWKT